MTTCQGNSPVSQATLNAITKMTGTHGGTSSGCNSVVGNGNPQVPAGSPIKFCDKADDDAAFVLEFPRCSSQCTTYFLTEIPCDGMCANGMYCCPTTGSSCIPDAETCPCPECADLLEKPPQCAVTDPNYFIARNPGYGASLECCIRPPIAIVPPPVRPRTACYSYGFNIEQYVFTQSIFFCVFPQHRRPAMETRQLTKMISMPSLR